VPGYNVQYILCQWAVAVKNIPSMLMTLPKRVWTKDGDSLPDSTLAYSEMPGGLNKEDMNYLKGKKITEEQYEKVRKQL